MRDIKFRTWDKENKLMGDAWIRPDEQCTLNSVLDLLNMRYVLMQYTGLKDKNGTEIYEGDIVKCSEGCPHEIVFGGQNGMPGWWLSGTMVGPLGDYAWTGIEEVIGSIHENPELLR